MAFSTILKRLREAAGMTQGELAEKSGIAKGSIANLEQGIREPALATAQALAEALGVSCEAFTQEDPEAIQEAPKPSRGRPRKPVEPEAEPKPKRGRGRPKKGTSS